MERHSFTVQVVPSREVQPFELITSVRKKDLVTIKRSILLDYVIGVIHNKTGIDTAELRKMRYYVRVFRQVIFSPGITKKLTELLHPDTSRDTEIDTLLNSLKDAVVLIMVTPADIANQHYDIPNMTTDYEIVVFDSTSNADEKKINAYDRRLKDLNNKLSEPLHLPAPTRPSRFKQLDTIAFIAKRGNLIIGYCICTMMPYLGDLSEPIATLIHALLSGEHIGEVLNRYLMGIEPLNLFEIEGLSVDPGESGKNIGLILLYQALRFILDTQIQRFFPVTHIGSQAASYITKRYLVNTFKFRYHGSDFFLNQHFLETLSDNSRALFLRAITQQIAYYNELLDWDGLGKMRKWLRTDDYNASEVMIMVANVIRLYQIYYLLLTTSRTFDCRRQEILAKFLPVFKSLEKLLSGNSDYSSLRRYFSGNIKNVEENNAIGIANTVYATSLGKYSEYGFLKKITGPATTRQSLLEGYDVIYKTLPNMITLSTYLKKANNAGYVLKIINNLVYDDLILQCNYEIPSEQLVAIREAIIEAWGGLSDYEEVIGDLTDEIIKKAELMDKNIIFNEMFTVTAYKAAEGTTSGLDTFISFDCLKSEWTDIEVSIFKRIKFVTTKTGEEEEEGSMEIDVISCTPPTSPPLELMLPKDKPSLLAETHELYRILVLGPSNTDLFIFKGFEYTTLQLKEYINALKEAVRTFDLIIPEEEQEEEMPEMLVEEIIIEPYRLEDFIDQDLLSDMSYSILGDTEIGL